MEHTRTVLEQYVDAFDGLGQLRPPVHFQVDENITPMQMPVHRIPLAKRAKEKEALNQYAKEGVLIKVTEPTIWCLD